MKYLLAILILLHFGCPKCDMFLGDNHSAFSWNKNNNNNNIIVGDSPQYFKCTNIEFRQCCKSDSKYSLIEGESNHTIVGPQEILEEGYVGKNYHTDTTPSWKQSMEYRYMQPLMGEERIEFKDTTHYRQISFTFIDSCQRFRDSISKYQRNILTWKRRLSPLNDPGYNILLNDKIKALEATKKKFYQLVKKCK